MDRWDHRFMKMAWLISEWSSCYRQGRKIGAVIVKDKRIMTTGYNGAPAGLLTCKERGECLRDKLNVPSGTRTELCYAIHAEQNALLNCSREQTLGADLYLAGVNPEDNSIHRAKPCPLCARLIIQAGIRDVILRTGPEAGDYEVVPAKKLIWHF